MSLDVVERCDGQAPGRQHAGDPQDQSDRADRRQGAPAVHFGRRAGCAAHQHAKPADAQRHEQDQADRDVDLAEHQQEGDETADTPDPQQAGVPVTPVGAQDQHREHGEDGEQRPPLLLVGEGAEENVAVFLVDQRPAGAVAAAILAGRRRPHRVQHRPVQEVHEDRAGDDRQHHRGDAVAPAREQILAHPSQHAGVDDGRSELGAFAGGLIDWHVGHAQRSRSAMRLLYQFMKAEIDRLTER